MAGLLQTLVNGHAYDFSSIKLTSLVPGAPPLLERFVSISYEHSLTPGKLRGRGSKVLARTRGEYDASGAITIYLEDWQLLRGGLMTIPLPPGGFMEKSFLINVFYAEVGCLPVEDVLRGCRVTNVSKAYQRGTDPLMVDLTLDILEVIEGGSPAVVDGSNVPTSL